MILCGPKELKEEAMQNVLKDLGAKMAKLGNEGKSRLVPVLLLHQLCTQMKLIVDSRSLQDSQPGAVSTWKAYNAVVRLQFSEMTTHCRSIGEGLVPWPRWAAPTGRLAASSFPVRRVR